MIKSKGQTYSSKSDIVRPLYIFKQILLDLPISIGLAATLAIRDLKAQYKTSKLGYLWALFQPAIYAMIYVVVRQEMGNAGLDIDTQQVHPALFAFFGIALWQVWMNGLTVQLEALRKSQDIVRNLKVPPETFFFAPLISSMIDLTIRIALIAVAIVTFDAELAETWFWFPLAAVAVVFTGHAIGYSLSWISSLYRDIINGVQSISLGILLASPILYSATTNQDSLLYLLNIYNPLAATLSTTRSVLFGGNFFLLNSAIVWIVGLTALVCIIMLINRVVHPLIIERLGI